MTGVDCTTDSLGDASDASAILSTATLGQLANLDSAPLRSIPLRSIVLTDSPLRSIPLRSIGDLSSVVDCTLVDCSVTSTATLGDASSIVGGILSTASLFDLGAFFCTALGQFLSSLNYSLPGFPTLTLNDLLAALTPPTSYPWQAVDLTSIPLAQYESAGGTDTLQASVTVSGSSPTPVAVSLTLPPGFAYLPGSATLDGNPLADPPSTSSPLSFTPMLSPGTHLLSVTVKAGTGLGPVTAHLSAAVGGATGHLVHHRHRGGRPQPQRHLGAGVAHRP